MNIWDFDVNNSFSILRDNVGVELFMSLIIANYYVYFTYALRIFATNLMQSKLWLFGLRIEISGTLHTSLFAFPIFIDDPF